MTDVKQGRSSRSKPDPVSVRELKARTPSEPPVAYTNPEEKARRRRDRIARLEAETARCDWCGEPQWRADHTGCEKALGAPVAPSLGGSAVVVPERGRGAPGASQR